MFLENKTGYSNFTNVKHLLYLKIASIDETALLLKEQFFVRGSKGHIFNKISMAMLLGK